MLLVVSKKRVCGFKNRVPKMEVLRNETRRTRSHIFCEQVAGDLLKSTHVYSFKTQTGASVPPS